MMVHPGKTGPARGHFFEKEPAARPCWNCEYESDDLHICSQCDKLQAFLTATDYFTWFGLGYLLSIDLDSLEKRYYALSRKFHPDFHQNSTPEEQAISLENTAYLTKSYRILKDPIKRISYLIGLIEGEKTLKTEAPAELFEEIFEIQETLETIKNLESVSTAQKEKLLQNLETDLVKMEQYQAEEEQGLEALSSKWDRLEKNRKDLIFGDDQKNHLNEMKKILSHRAYLDRIIQDIRSTLDRS